MKISMIACVGKNLELGKNNKLIWSLKKDLNYFKKVTEGKMVVMGKNTFLSLPSLLKNRQNVIISKTLINNKLEIYSSILDFLNKYQDYQEEIFIIGGASIYKQFLELATKLYLTEVNLEDKTADTYFPEFDKNKYQKEIIAEEMENGIQYTYTLYRRK